MSDRHLPGWLDAEGAAYHLSITLPRFRKLVADGVLPKPVHTLGDRTPRWRMADLDVTMDPSTASTDPRIAVTALAEKIEEEGRSRRQA